MANISVYFATVAKKKNSTYQPNCTARFDVSLKNTTSIDRPTFLLSAPSFPYNYCTWDNNYYFVDNVVSPRQGQWEVSCIIDPLATYKDYILDSIQFVAYSSLSGGAWLPDTRIPVLKSTSVSNSTTSMSSILNDNGFYVLTAVGQEGCRTYACDKTHLTKLLQNVNSWVTDTVNGVLGASYDWSDTQKAIQSLSEIMCNTDILGNAYQQAPQCIRSCIWVPFAVSPFLDGAPSGFYLGIYECQLSPVPYYCKSTPVTGSVSVSIPWHYSDWRRATCEDVYLYLPLVGSVQLSGDSLTHVSSLSIDYSVTATDGVISYEVRAGSEIIGTFGGQCSANYPIGINQQASAGELLQTVIAGAEKTIAAGIASSLSPNSVAMSAVGMGFEALATGYNIKDTAYTRHLTTIGGVGGGAGAGLNLNVMCSTVSHPTAINPSDMRATMGVPTMQPVQLSTLSGYCECVNAHVSAPAEAHILDAIDAYINSGFYIE